MLKLLPIAAAALLLTACTPPPTVGSGSIDFATLALPNDRNRAVMAQNFAESTNKSVYTLAVAPTGNWGARGARDFSPADRRRSALQICEHGVRGVACGLVIDNGVAVPTYSPQPAGLVYGGRFNPTNVPFVAAVTQSRMLAEYVPIAGNKALAIHWNGSWAYRRGATPEEAQRAALASCNELSRSEDCFIYDVNGTVVFARETPLRKPRR